MKRYIIEYSVCDFETQRVFRGRDVEEALARFLQLVVELGGVEEADIDYYTIREIESADNVA